MLCTLCYRQETQIHPDGSTSELDCLLCGSCLQRLLALSGEELQEFIRELISKGKMDKAQVVATLAGGKVEDYEQEAGQTGSDTFRGSPLRMARPALKRLRA